MHRYRAYGLAVASEIELPELVADADGDAPDLHIRLGGVPETLDDPVEERVTWAARPGAWLHEVDGVARYYVTDDGREVRVESLGGSPADIRAFLFASTLGAVLHQRGLFVLHASAVVTPHGAVAVAGPSGVGKSTTLTELARRGHPVLSDDKTVIRFADDGPEVLSGYPSIRLWHDAVKRIGEDPQALPAIREGLEKYLYRASGFQTEPAPLRALVVLHPVREGRPEIGKIRIERRGAHQAVQDILKQTYRRRIVHGAGLRTEHFAWAARLADTVPVTRVVRPRLGQTVPDVADAVEEAVAASVRPA